MIYSLERFFNKYGCFLFLITLKVMENIEITININF